MELIPCPYCKADIENDSHYCDQCGEELYRCPSCGKFVKEGKFCTSCGKPGVKITEPTAKQPAEPPQPSPKVQPSQYQAPNPSQKQSQYQATSPATSQVPSQLFCPREGIMIQLQSDAVIGRVNGNYASQLGGLSYMSGTHARVSFNGQRWSITDLGSRNGTAVNGVKCQPNVSVPIKKGDIIRFADEYDFNVQ